MITFLVVMAGAFLVFAAGFVMGTAYGVQQEERAQTERQRMLRALKRRFPD